ncbi:hypothetical protein Scani_34490 [Streptomyces caniferus]|uniref:Uncharacterized protein n=1 Tax=Streptomyces caniferus TaxID=285557 RepID=A0A640S9S6_9ACTN|nr:hypothetical protein [Streptomyces caniferus]GFE07181.1 hypothetical protein Scani_34490 [Streptomyces caniferus]
MKHTARALRSRLTDRWLTCVARMTSSGNDAGLETLEKLIIGAVLIVAATAFGVAFNGKFDSLMNTFKSSF